MYDAELSEEQKKILEERIESYNANPDKHIEWDEINAILKSVMTYKDCNF